MNPYLLNSAAPVPTAAAEGNARARAGTVRCRVSQHRIPDRIVTANLAGQLDRHVGGDWWAIVMFADRRGASFGRSATTTAPPFWAIEWMAKAAIALNHDLHVDGHWVAAWGPEALPVLIWRDGDGDIHTAMEIAPERGAATAEFLASIDKPTLLSRAQEALSRTAANLAILELSRGQTHRLALGEGRR